MSSQMRDGSFTGSAWYCLVMSCSAHQMEGETAPMRPNVPGYLRPR